MNAARPVLRRPVIWPLRLPMMARDARTSSISHRDMSADRKVTQQVEEWLLDGAESRPPSFWGEKTCNLLQYNNNGSITHRGATITHRGAVRPRAVRTRLRENDGREGNAALPHGCAVPVAH